MKSSTLHRSGLTKERMNMFDDVKPANINKFEGIPQYSSDESASELDLLYGKSVPKKFVKPQISRTPAVYLTVGFFAGVLFTLVIVGIIAISTKEPKHEVVISDTTVQTSTDSAKEVAPLPVSQDGISTNEKYTIKAGDTLDKIAYRFYGKYDNTKIEEIQRINNIKNPARLQLGQEIIIPISR